MRLFFFFLLVFVAVANPGESFAQGDFTVKSRRLQDEKAVFATVESVHVIAARTRIAGTLADVAVTEGDAVRQDQTLAKVGDEKLALQIGGMDSRIHSLKAQFDKAQTDLDRAKSLFASGTVAKARLDEAQTQYNIAQSALVAGQADRDVIRRQVGEGDVLAPVSGRVLSVLVTQGAVVMPGEPVALIAEENYVLRLQVPERHARYLKKGDSIRLDDGKTGKIVTVYPKIENGRVVADAVVEGLGDYFVGERVRVRISGGERQAFVVPASYVVTRFGIDHVRLKGADGAVMEAPVQMGVAVPLEDVPDGVEILSGLRDGDVLVTP
ncbi:MAG: efflux RND transporter periplasmic adaptor subunit [Rhodospirillales bacterium]|nr:efflux RND transporter periplasmic adaptor subunit [Rhodospirillales bacterium]